MSFRVVCATDGAHIQVELRDSAPFTYEVFVDDLNTPVFDDPLLDTGNEYLDLGVYANGVHAVSVNWLDSPDGSPYYENRALSVGCPALDDSGAGVPPVGGSTSPILLVGGALVALGGGLLLARRRRWA
ncbi:MAG: LPXTG cell wall anchor domain-containing protein [Actinomycetota bacterium]|nr:LPXTG cell wall anchor domain-containing protein [Actinomycetota bacterium]